LAVAGRPDQFGTEEEIVVLGERLLDRTLPREEWTHAAHFAATLFLMLRRPDLDLPRELPRIIRSYNDVIGVPNTGTRGYHETLTQFYLRAIADFLGRAPAGAGLTALCAELIGSPIARRDFPFRFYSRERLFSPEAKTSFVEPDLQPLGFGDILAGRPATDRPEPA